MPLNTQATDLLANLEVAQLTPLASNGLLRVYDGTQPATGDTAITTQVLGVTITLAATAFGAASGGIITANAGTAGVAVAGITPTWYRLFKADGTTAVIDGSAGASGSNLTIGAFTAGTSVNFNAFTHQVRKSSSGL